MNIKHLIRLLIPVLPTIIEIEKQHGTAYLVGGSVRDLALKKPIFDIDIEVHGLTSEQIIACLAKTGSVHFIGKKFGVFRIGSIDIDWSLPRTDSLGRKPIVTVDPFMGIKAASRRRDLRMNSMAIRLNSNKDQSFGIDINNIIDPFKGLDDIKHKRLGVIDSELFIQDPLRLYRVVQYISRFEMEPDDELTSIAQTISLLDPITDKPIAEERIGVEIKKMLLLSRHPSLGIAWTEKIGRLHETFPSLISLQNINSFYTSKNSLKETYRRLDDCSKLYKKQIASTEYPLHKNNKKLLGLMVTLLHAEFLPENPKDVIKHQLKIIKKYGFGIETKLIKKLLNAAVSIENSQEEEKYVYKMIAYDLAPQWNIYELLILHAILYNRSNLGTNLEKAKNWNVLYEPEQPLLDGQYFLDQEMTGKELGIALKNAYDVQIRNNITDIAMLKKQLKK